MEHVSYPRSTLYRCIFYYSLPAPIISIWVGRASVLKNGFAH
jgi:hypothetical protein